MFGHIHFDPTLHNFYFQMSESMVQYPIQRSRAVFLVREAMGYSLGRTIGSNFFSLYTNRPQSAGEEQFKAVIISPPSPSLLFSVSELNLK